MAPPSNASKIKVDSAARIEGSGRGDAVVIEACGAAACKDSDVCARFFAAVCGAVTDPVGNWLFSVI